jgi:hypothetical protein
MNPTTLDTRSNRLNGRTRPNRPTVGPAPATRRRRAVRALATALTVGALASSVAVGASGSPASAASLQTDPVLLVHGFNATFNTNCNDSTMRAWRNGLISRGWSDVRTVGWYANDTNCSLNVQSRWNNTSNTSLDEIAREFAWTVRNHFTRNGQPVAIAAHSMGGLIVNRAIQGVMLGEPGYPDEMHVTDVVASGTPFAGSAWAATCADTTGVQQCVQAKPGSAFLTTLAHNPQGRLEGGAPGRTQWSLAGSDCDAIVSSSSARSMGQVSSARPTVQKIRYTAPPWFGCADPASISHEELITQSAQLRWISDQLRA